MRSTYYRFGIIHVRQCELPHNMVTLPGWVAIALLILMQVTIGGSAMTMSLSVSAPIVVLNLTTLSTNPDYCSGSRASWGVRSTF